MNIPRHMLFAALLLLAGLASAAEAPKPDAQQRQPFQFDIGVLHSDDYSDWSPSLSFDINWKTGHEGGADTWETMAAFQAKGTLALDADLVREPLKAAFDFGASRTLGSSTAGWSDKPSDASEIQKANALFFDTGLSARYETDQNFDHRNGVASAFIGLYNINVEHPRALIPSLRVAFEGVEGGANATAAALDAEPGAHGRLTASADWRIGLAMLRTRSAFIDRLHLHIALEYAKDFGTPANYDAADLDETFGGLVELAYNFKTGAAEAARPRSVFIRGQFGALRPIPDDDRSLLMGVRFGF